MESERLRIFSNISIINKIISCYHCLYSFFYYCHLIQRQHTVLTLSFGWVCGPLMSWGCQQPTAPESAGAASSGYFGGLELALYCSSKLQQVSLAARTNFPFSYLYAKSGIHLHFHFHTVVSYIFCHQIYLNVYRNMCINLRTLTMPITMHPQNVMKK